MEYKKNLSFSYKSTISSPITAWRKRLSEQEKEKKKKEMQEEMERSKIKFALDFGSNKIRRGINRVEL